MPLDIDHLAWADLDEAVEVLTEAFREDPLMHYFFPEDMTFEKKLGALLRFSCEVRLELTWPLLGCKDGDRHVAVACVSAPGKPDWSTKLSERYELLTSIIGANSKTRLGAYSKLTDDCRPDEPHYYIAVLGVLSSEQGKGYGRALIEAVQRILKNHPESTGVGLDTENLANVSYYERFGFQVVAHEMLCDIDVWCMFGKM